MIRVGRVEVPHADCHELPRADAPVLVGVRCREGVLDDQRLVLLARQVRVAVGVGEGEDLEGAALGFAAIH